MYNVTLRPVRVIIVTVEIQQVLNIVCVRIFALVIQHAKRMRRIILSFVAAPALPHFSALFQQRHGLRNNVTEHMCVLILLITFV